MKQALFYVKYHYKEERCLQVFRCPQNKALLHAVVIGRRRQYYDGYEKEVGVIFHFLKHLNSAYSRHHQVDERNIILRIKELSHIHISIIT